MPAVVSLKIQQEMQREPNWGSISDASMDNSADEIAGMTKRMAKLWWQDTDQETSGKMPPNSSFGDDGNRGESIWINKAKYIASASIQAAMEKIWAKELYEMDSKEREDINNGIHGVPSGRAIEETPDVIFEGVRLLRDHIDERLRVSLDSGEQVLTCATREAYDRVLVSECREGGNKVPYFQTEKFLIKFLRAAHFDIEEAGQRFFRCLDLMHVLFGDIALKRPLMMSDLTAREQRYLKKGQQQLLPCRDRVGRRIYAYSGRDDKVFTVPEKYRVCMYLMDVCSEDETTQKLGIVLVCGPRIDPGDKPFGEGMALQPKKYEKLGGLTELEFHRKFENDKPLRTSAIHYYGPDTTVYNIGKALVLLMVGKGIRKFIRFHMGSQMECNYGLRSFGIPSEEVPITDDGQIKNKKFARFIAARKSIEAIQKQQYQQGEICIRPPGTECPEVNCVTFGNRARYNSSNLEFRNILKVMEQDREEKIERCESVGSVREFVNDIIRTAKSPEHNLRFATIDKKTSLFVEIEDPQELYTVVSQSLRDQRKRMRMEKRLRQSTDSGINIFNDFGSGDSGSIIGFEAAKRRKGSSGGCCHL